MFTVMQDYMQYTTGGGILDITVLMGPTPSEVVKQLGKIVGTQHLLPYWALGFHQSKWGYSSITEISTVEIPLEVIWNDVDYMNNYMDFTNDPVNYPAASVSSFVTDLHSNNQHYVIILDPCVAPKADYYPYESGLSWSVLVLNDNGTAPLIGENMPGECCFIDWSSENATSYWKDNIQSFFQSYTVFDGLWIDENEPTNFCDAVCPPESPPTDQWNNPPWIPEGVEPMYSETFSLAAHMDLDIHYNLHNIYGYLESQITRTALEQLTGERAFVLSRSTFLGSSMYAAAWTGDNNSSFASMTSSVKSLLSLSLSGMEFVGADICGFQGDATAELCSRWIELGSFYPFARNHNELGTRDQELYSFDTTTTAISQSSLHARYRLLPYLYTLFVRAHLDGETVWRPLFFEFPGDSVSHSIDEQFLVGPALNVCPVLTAGTETVSCYLPSASLWYDYWAGTLRPVGVQVYSAPLDVIPVFLRGGYIIPRHVDSGYTTEETELKDIELIVALDKNQNAQGELFLDDHLSLDSYSQNKYTLATFTAQSDTLFISCSPIGYTPSNKIVSVTILGLPDCPDTVKVNGNKYTKGVECDLSGLVIQDLSIDFASGSETAITWILDDSLSGGAIAGIVLVLFFTAAGVAAGVAIIIYKKVGRSKYSTIGEERATCVT
ncbi:lysosomal alpha-glucosidase [Pelomyxa schiedti]|nr:lysosomal alpha-glucosidase [Pelomyxa schiedti]